MRLWRALLLLIAGAAAISPPDLNSCGPFIPEARFTFMHGPIDPRNDFGRGEIGVLRPHFYRQNLAVAYRYLEGLPLSRTEMDTLYPPSKPPRPPNPELQKYFSFGASESAARWLAAREKVPGAKHIDKFSAYRQKQGVNFYDAYQNCLDDAFNNAVATLQDRSSKWGAQSAQLAEWLRGQDQVFENCSAGPAIPPPLPSASGALLAADREYQIASAEFYAEKFTDARRHFQEIASGLVSPWRDAAPYLVARTLIRQSTLQNNPQALNDARQMLQAIVTQQKWRGPAQDLLDFIAARLDPPKRLTELGAILLRPQLGSKVGQAMADYTFLWDKLEKDAPRADPLTDWIATFQGSDFQHALDRWREHRDTAWLVAAIVSAPADNAAVPELLSAARKTSASEPAYPTLAYYGIRLDLDRRDDDAARQWADEALAAKKPAPSNNLFLTERLKLARDWSEFLRYAPREPVAETSIQDDEPLEAVYNYPQLNQDATDPLNNTVPLSLWIDAAKNPLLPANLRAGIAQAGWVRAVALDRRPEAIAFAKLLAPGLNGYLAQPDPASAKFSAVFFMLHTPGLQPVVRPGFGRMEKSAELDQFRDNWWQVASPQGQSPYVDKLHEPLFDLYRAGDFGPKNFLPATERAQGEAESTKLRAAANIGANFLCSETLGWASAHPQDDRVPEALHLCVRATRYGPTDDTTGAFSKRAFDLLHARYPKTKWAQITRYWFK